MGCSSTKRRPRPSGERRCCADVRVLLLRRRSRRAARHLRRQRPRGRRYRDRAADDHLRAAAASVPQSRIEEVRGPQHPTRRRASPSRSLAAAPRTGTTTTTAISICSSRRTTARRGCSETTAATNQLLRVSLVGAASNRDAIGAQGRVRCATAGPRLADGEDRLELSVAERVAADFRAGQGGESERHRSGLAERPDRKSAGADAGSARDRRRRKRYHAHGTDPLMRYAAALVLARLAAVPQPGPGAPDRLPGASILPRRSANAPTARTTLASPISSSSTTRRPSNRFARRSSSHPDLALARLNLAIALFYAGRPAEAAVRCTRGAKRHAGRAAGALRARPCGQGARTTSTRRLPRSAGS